MHHKPHLNGHASLMIVLAAIVSTTASLLCAQPPSDPATIPPSASAEIATLCKKGTNSIAEGKWEDARDNLARLVTLDEQNHQAYYWLAYSLHQLGQYAESIPPLDKAISISPTNAVYYVLLAAGLNNVDRDPESVAAAKKAVALDKNNPERHTFLGDILQSQKKYDGAARAYRNALPLAPNDVSIHLQLATTLWKMKDYASAAQSCSNAIALQSTNASLYASLGDILNAAGKYGAATDAYQEALSLGTDSTEILVDTGWCLRQQGKHAEAVTMLEKAHEREPDDPLIRTLLLCVCFEAGQLNRAAQLIPAWMNGVAALLYLAGLALLVMITIRKSKTRAPGLVLGICWLYFSLAAPFLGLFLAAGLPGAERLSPLAILLFCANVPLMLLAGIVFARQPWGEPYRAPVGQLARRLLRYGLVGLFALLAFNAFYSYAYTWTIGKPLPEQSIASLIGQSFGINAILVLFATIVVAPVGEEILYRGMLFSPLQKRWGNNVAVVITAMVFAAAHVDPRYFVPLFGMGLATGILRAKTKSIFLPTIVHIINNATGITLMLLTQGNA